MYRKRLVLIILCTAVLCALLALTGCKPSPAFVQTLYDDKAEEIDEGADVSLLDNDKDNSDEDPRLPPQAMHEELGDPRNRERKSPMAGKDRQFEAAPEPEHNEDANPDKELGSSDPEPPEENPAETPPPQETPQSSDAEAAGLPGETAAETEPPVPEKTGEPKPEPLPALTRQVVDAAGRTVELPETVEHVAAVGEAAILVEMLGGRGRLSASSASMGQGLSGQLLTEDHETLWSGDGRSPLSGEGFSRLLELAPQACLELSGQTSFSEEQIETLKEAGIAYVVLPSLNTDPGIRDAVALVGQVLGSEGEADARKRAEEYMDFHDRVLALAASRVQAFLPDGIDYATGKSAGEMPASDGVYAVFVSGWDPAAKYSLHDDAYETLSGTGLPYTATGYLRSPVTYYLSLAGVANSAALKENNYSITGTKLKYISPIHSPNKTLSVESTAGITYDPGYVFTSAGNRFLGESAFPAVVAANEEIRKGIKDCPLWADYGVTESSTGLTSGYGFPDQNGDIVITTVHGPYAVLVLPSGVGNWAEGSAESVLTTLWAAWKLRGAVSESEVRSFTTEFYERFYEIRLSETQLDAILHEGTE